MDPYEKTFNTWDSLAYLYQDTFMKLDIYNESYDLFCSYLHKKKPTILEIGCGPGNITKHLLDKHPNYRILATDVAPNMVRLAKKNVPKASFQKLDCRYLLSLKKSFDGIMCGFALPYLTDIDAKKFIEDSHKILNEDGVLYVSFVDGNYEDSEFMERGHEGIYFYYHELSRIETTLINQGFTILQSLKVSYDPGKGLPIATHTIVIAQK